MKTPSPTDEAALPLMDCSVKPWLVKGIAMVPVEVEMVVMARTAGVAEGIAQAKFRAMPRDYIVANSHDDSAAHSWVPFVSPNIKVEARDL
jgi:hypothetical protein